MKNILILTFLFSGTVWSQGLTSLADRADQIARFLRVSEGKLSDYDRIETDLLLLDLERVSQNYGPISSNPFKFKLVDDSLLIYDRESGNKLLTWNKHDKMQRSGNLIGLNDTEGEFRAFKNENGVAVNYVKNWNDTIDFLLTSQYIGLVDSKGVTDVYSSLVPNKKLIDGWKSTIKHFFHYRYIVLLDNETNKNLEVFDVQGVQLFKQTGVTDVKQNGQCIIEYLKNGKWQIVDISMFL